MLEKEIRTFYDSYINDIEIQSENLNPEKKHELQESLKEIKSAQNFLEKCSYILKFKSTHFSIFLINNSQDEILNIRIIHLCKRLEFLYKYLNFQNPFNFNIWLIPLSIKRIFPNDSVQISFNNINGGFTYVNGNDIYIHKEEEFPKVVLHEVLHHSKFDTGNQWSISELNTLREIFEISQESNFNPNEAIIELWAEIYHLAFISYELSIPFNILYASELKWGIYQTDKLLKHKKTFKNPLWKEKTNAFSYIIIKTILLNNLTNFLKLKTPYTSEVLKNFIINSYNKLKKKLNTKSHIKSHTKSLRMTIYGDL